MWLCCIDCKYAEVGSQGSVLKLHEKQNFESRMTFAGLKVRAMEMGVERQIDDHTQFGPGFDLPSEKPGVRSCVYQTLLRLLGNRIEVDHW